MPHRFLSGRLARRHVEYAAGVALMLCMCLIFYYENEEIALQLGYTAQLKTREGDFVVPNIVHFVRLGNAPLSFVEVVCIRAAWLHQNPDILFIHCENCSSTVRSPNWKHVKDIPQLVVSVAMIRRTLFGTKVTDVSDNIRVEILRKYGGIYLDSDTFIVGNMDEYRRHELSIGWPSGENIRTQVIVASRDSRCLRLWSDSFRWYRLDLLRYKTGRLPSESFDGPKPGRARRVPWDFGVHESVTDVLYKQCNDAWKDYTAINLFWRYRQDGAQVSFDNVAGYKTNFGQMARLVLAGTTKPDEFEVRNITSLSANRMVYSLRGCS